MTVAGGLEIRPGSVADLPALVAVFGQRRWFSDQLARQRAGDVYLSLEPDPNQVVRRHLPGVPTLVHLEVLGPYQRRGIGSALIHAGEDTVRRLGHSGHPVTVSEAIHMLVRTL